MEAKLKEYRARRRRQEFVEKTTEKFENTKRRFVDLFKKMIKNNVDENEDTKVDIAPAFTEVPAKHDSQKKRWLEKIDYEEDDSSKEVEKEDQCLIETDNEEEVLDESKQETWLQCIMKWTFYSVIWLTLYFYFITLQFGAVFFAISLLIGIYLNTGTRKRKKGEASAYSVFNENCESIDGTVTAETLQKEMFFGSFRLF